MFHMLSCFNLLPDEDIDIFRKDYNGFVDHMKSVNLVESSGPIGRRQSDTPMDTDDERNHEYFVLMTFVDRPQVDAAYAYIMKHVEPGETAHNNVLNRVQDSVFVCWQDLS